MVLLPQAARLTAEGHRHCQSSRPENSWDVSFLGILAAKPSMKVLGVVSFFFAHPQICASFITPLRAGTSRIQVQSKQCRNGQQQYLCRVIAVKLNVMAHIWLSRAISKLSNKKGLLRPTRTTLVGKFWHLNQSEAGHLSFAAMCFWNSRNVSLTTSWHLKPLFLPEVTTP